MNCSNVGVWLYNSQQSVIANCVFYACAALNTDPWPNWTGVLLQGTNGRFTKVIGNIFSMEAGRTGDTRVAIDFNEGRCYSATGNHIFGFSGYEIDYGVYIRSGVSNCVVGDDNIFEYVTTEFTNAGATSVRQPRIQSGSVTGTTGVVVTFDNAFPNECTSVIAIHNGTNTAVNVTASSVSTTGFTLNHNSGGSSDFYYLATGN
jgi:hypothetical protein